MVTIHFFPDKKSVCVPEGTTLLEAQKAAGLLPDAPCGGNGSCGKCSVTIAGSFPAQRVLACQYHAAEDLTVYTAGPEGSKNTVILEDGFPIRCPVRPAVPGELQAAVDIGTTTVVCYLLDGRTGQALAVSSCLNPQRSFGADVVTRICAAGDGHREELTALIRKALSGLIAESCRKAARDPQKIAAISIAANTCMQQLFLGMDCKNLTSPPFLPYIRTPRILQGEPLLSVCPEAAFLLLPAIAGYVGADTLACILSSEMYLGDGYTLLIDIGTNGEMALSCDGRILTCSTAAGPALEGANISCGMRGEAGAIDHVWYEDGRLAFSVIGEQPAKGICGSGLIDLIAVLLSQGRLNRRGRIQGSFEEQDGQRIIRLTDQVALTQDDVRQVMLAKGAIRAGIDLMLAEASRTPADVEQVYLAGAFGSFIRPASACRIGLLPPELLPKISAVGNAAGAGAQLAVLDGDLFDKAGQIASSAQNLELASLPQFQKVFAASMAFTE